MAVPTGGSALPDLLAVLPASLYALDPLPTRVLACQPVGPAGWRVDGNLIEVADLAGTPAPFLADLRFDPTDDQPDPARRRPLTLAGLAAALTGAGYPAQATDGWADTFAIVLLDGQGRLDADGGLAGFTAVLWRVLRMMAALLDLLGDDTAAALRTLDLRFAAGQWLDWWGTLYGVARLDGQGDDAYRARITYLTTRPRTNGVAIAAAIAALCGVTATLTDGSPLGTSLGIPDSTSALDVTWSAASTAGRFWPGYPPRFVVHLPTGTDAATIAAVRALVERLRAAGTTYTIAADA